MVLHKQCGTEVIYESERYGTAEHTATSVYCYTLCPRCNIEAYGNELIIGGLDAKD